MNWLIWSFIGAFLTSVWSLSMKLGVSHVFPTDFANWYGFVAMIGMMAYNFFTKVPYQYSTLALLTGLFQAITSISITKSIDVSPNPGSSMAVFRAQAVLTTILAYFLFKEPLSVSKIIATIVVVIGVYITSSDPSAHQKPGKKEGFQVHSESQESKDKKGASWFVFAIIAAVAITAKDLVTKICLNKGADLRIENVILNALIGQTIVLMIYDRYRTGNFKLEDINRDKKVDSKDVAITVWTGLILLAYIFAVTYSVKTAPNVGYAKSIETLGVIITAVVSHFIFKSKLTKRMLLGIGLIIGGIMYISFE